MIPTFEEWRLLSPELILSLTALFALAAAASSRGDRPGEPNPARDIALIGTLFALASAALLTARHPSVEVGSLVIDGPAMLIKLVTLVGTAVVLLMSYGYGKRLQNAGEFYAILVFSGLAMCMLASAGDLITIYLSLEFVSLTSYVLAGYLKEDPRSNEAAIKYFLYGSVSAAVMLYGLSILYGLTGTMSLSELAPKVADSSDPLVVPAACMVAVGLFFKVAVVPFHQWTPDIYEGAPTPVTAFLSVAPKAAGFGLLLRVVLLLAPASLSGMTFLLALLAAATMTIGNLAAIPQTNVKRMLAYSSIAQAGYVLMGIAAATAGDPDPGLPAALIYLTTYLFMNLGIFGVVIAAERVTGSEEIRDYGGFRERSPLLAWMMVLFLLSLAGLPPTAGFIGKLYLFLAVLGPDSTLVWLAAVAAINTAISVYYYFNLVRTMLFAPIPAHSIPTGENARPIPAMIPPGLRTGVLLSFVMTLALGVFPGALIALAFHAGSPFTR